MSFNKSLGFLLRDYLYNNNIDNKMFKNIKHNNVRSLKLKLRCDRYYDFMLYRGECVSTSGNQCVVADIKPYNMSEGKVVSEVEWLDAINEGVILNNIGYTGVDNGLIQFRRDKVSNAEFLNIYTGSTYEVDETKAFYMTPVSGNTNQYKYFYDLENDENGGYMSLKGGFLQGFYKLYGYDYQTLPNVIDDEWNFEVVLRRREYDVHYRSLNYTHPENNGMFFYIGTRAENKFWRLYDLKNDISDLQTDEYNNDGYFENNLDDVIKTDYFSETTGEVNENAIGVGTRIKTISISKKHPYFQDSYFAFNDISKNISVLEKSIIFAVPFTRDCFFAHWSSSMGMFWF